MRRRRKHDNHDGKKQRPRASPSSRLSPKEALALAGCRPRCWASTQPAPPSPLSCHCTGVPQKGIDAPAARSSRTAASAVTPSEGTTYRVGPDSTARVTPPSVESVEEQQRRLQHPPPWVPNVSCPRDVRRKQPQPRRPDEAQPRSQSYRRRRSTTTTAGFGCRDTGPEPAGAAARSSPRTAQLVSKKVMLR